MKITENNNFINTDVYARMIAADKKVDNSENNNTEGTLKNDKVVLSATAKIINEAKKNIDSLPDIREQKIAQIKAQIEEGSYRINEKMLASRMLKEALLNKM